jgi:hypothetical protein
MTMTLLKAKLEAKLKVLSSRGLSDQEVYALDKLIRAL